MLLRFLALYGAMFAAFGTASPFLPAFLGDRGLSAPSIALVLAAGTATRLIAGPLGGTIADRIGAPRQALTVCAAAAGALSLGYLPVAGVWPFLAVSIAQAAVLASLIPVADALTLAAAATSGRFAYGWVRGAGSASFIVGSVLSGQLIDRLGIGVIIWLESALLAAAALCSLLVPDLLKRKTRTPETVRSQAVLELLKIPIFRRLMLVAGLIQGSHALHDSFAVIRWQAAGISSQSISLLWSESVAAEVVVFVLLGRPLVNRLGVAGASALAAIAGVVRWAVLAQTASVLASALVEPLHGLTFALQHLASMQLIAMTVPRPFAATAQALYGTVAIGLTTTLVTLGSGELYGHLGAGGFWVMAALCAAALPLTVRLRPASSVRA